MTTIDELRALAREIREERQIGGNTGARVGNTFDKVADLLESTGGDISDIREAVEQLLQDVGFIPRDVSRTATDAVFTNSEGDLLFWLRAATDTLAGLITAANNNKLIALPTAEELAQALAAKQNRLTFDQQPIEGSTNPVTSDGINTAIANFITRSVSDLIYYYTKSETYTKGEVDALVAAIKQFVPIVAPTLPTASADTMYKLYLVPSEDPKESNVKDEYITIDNGASANPRYTWEKIGSTDIDISGKADIDTVPVDVTRTQTDATFVNGNHDSLFYLRQATSSLAGLMTSVEHTKLGALPTAQDLNTRLEGTIYDISVLHPTSGVSGGNTYSSLSAALAVIPQDKKKGGMTVRYIQTYDNKYSQFRFMLSGSFTTAQFTNTANWQKDTTSGDLTQSIFDLKSEIAENITVFNRTLNLAQGQNHIACNLENGYFYRFTVSGDGSQQVVIYTNTKASYDASTIKLVGSLKVGETSKVIDFTADRDSTYLYIWTTGAISVTITIINNILPKGAADVHLTPVQMPDWEPNTPYVKGNQRKNEGHYYRANKDIAAKSTFDTADGWTEISNFTAGGASLQTIHDDNKDFPIYNPCIKLVGMGTMFGGDSGVTKNGDIYYNTSSYCLYQASDYVSPTSFSNTAVPFIDGAIYTFNNGLYLWNGSDLVRAFPDIPIILEVYDNVEGYMYVIADSEGKIVFALKKDGDITLSKMPLLIKQYVESVKKELLVEINKGQDIETTFPNILPNYIMPSGTEVMAKYINGSYAAANINTLFNFFDESTPEGSLQHDGNLVIIGDYAYCVYLTNSGGTDAMNDLAQVKMKKVNLTDTSDNATYSIAKKDDVFGDITMTSGAATPNIIAVGTVAHIFFQAMTNQGRCIVHTTFDTETSEFGTYSIITLTKGGVTDILNNDTLISFFGKVYYSTQMGCTIGKDGDYYYAGVAVASSSNDGMAFIMKSTNLVDWTYVTTMDFGCGAIYEIACWCKNGYLYACKRLPWQEGISSSDNAMLSPLAKYNLSTNKWVEAVAVKNCGTKPAFFEYAGYIHLITFGTTRSNAQIIRIDETELANSKVVDELNTGKLQYPSIAVVDTTLYAIGTENLFTSMPLMVLSLYNYTEAQIDAKMLNIMSI